MMKRYEKYKYSDVGWIGEIPEHWKVCRLATLGRFTASGIDKLSLPNQTKVKIINYTDVYKNERRIINSDFDFMEVTTPENNRINNLVKKGDLIFLPSSETFEDLGLSALVVEDLENVSFSYHVLRFQFKIQVFDNFKKYFTNNYSVLRKCSANGVGSIRKTLNRNDFRNIYVLLPPISEQRDISNFLDEKTTKIDQAIAIKQKEIELLKERHQILIQKAVTKGLDDTVKLKDCGVDWIGEIPEHWEVVKNKTIFKESKKPGEEDLPLLSVSIHSGISDNELSDEENIRGKIKIEDKSNYKLVFKNDIVYNMMRAWQGAIGSVAVKGLVSPAYVVATPSTKVFSKFFEYQYRTPILIEQMNQYSKGITDFRKRLYWEEFKQIFTILPPFEEQISIVNYIDKIEIKVSKAISIKQQEIEKLKEYKTVVIDNVVTGKVRVS